MSMGKEGTGVFGKITRYLNRENQANKKKTGIKILRYIKIYVNTCIHVIENNEKSESGRTRNNPFPAIHVFKRVHNITVTAVLHINHPLFSEQILSPVVF